MNAPDHDWQALGAAWRGQATPAPDLEAVAREVRRRGRRLRWLVAGELSLTVLALAFLALILWHGAGGAVERAVLVVFAALLVPYQAAVLWLRRRELRDEGLDVAALVALEIRRATSGITYWRLSVWTAMAMWVGLVAVALLEPAGRLRQDLWVFQLVYTPMMLACGAFAWWRGRRSRERIARYQALRDQLRAP